MRALPLVLLAACGPARVPFTDDDACVRIATDALRFEGARIAVPEERTLEIANACDRIIAVHPALAGSEAFTAPDWAEVPALGAVELPIGFTAPGYAPEAGTLAIAALSVALNGVAAPDQDGDGHDATQADGDDCDDADASVHAGAEELRDLQDQDCDGVADDGLVRPGDVYVTELMVTPAAGPRWLELTNASAYDIELGGMTLSGDDGDALVLPAYVLSAGESVVLGGSAPVADIVWTGFELAESDSLALTHGDVALQYVEWDASWGFEAGASLGLDPIVGTRANAGDRRNWCPSVTPMADGDHGTPRAANDACGHLDHDGDGWTVDEGDCDDALAAVNPDAIELWNDRDDDCDETVDQAVIDDVATGYLNNPDLGYLRVYGAGDLDGDGSAEVLFGASSVFLVDGPTALHGAGYASWYASSVISADPANLWGTPPRFADVSGDGAADLVLSYNDRGDSGLAVYTNGAALAANVALGDATLLVADPEYPMQEIEAFDLDGDGVAEVVGARFGGEYEGYVQVLATGSATGAVDVADVAEARLVATWGGDIPMSLAGGDVDGDGAIDIVAGSRASATVDRPGACSIVLNDATRSDGNLPDAASARISGVDDQWLCDGLDVADIDGDDVADVVASANDGVYVFLGGDALSGTLTTADAAVVLPAPAAEIGTPVVTGDVDGDGAPDIVVGSGRMKSESTAEPGESVSVHLGRDLRSAVTTAARSATSGSGRTWLGETVLAPDLDGDGLDDLLVAAPYLATRGRVWLVESE